MNRKIFTVSDFKVFVLRLLNAANSHDGIALQKMSEEITDRYKETTMTHYEYETLYNLCDIFLEDWRLNWK